MGSTLGPTLANTFLRVSKCRGWGGGRERWGGIPLYQSKNEKIPHRKSKLSLESSPTPSFYSLSILLYDIEH